MVDGVFKRMANAGWVIPVVLQIVNVHVHVTEAPSGGEVKVPNDLVHPKTTFNTATLSALLLQLFGVVLSFALLDVLATAKSPRCLRVGFSDLVASGTASGLDSIARSGCAVAGTAVVGIEMLCSLVGGMAGVFRQQWDKQACLRKAVWTYSDRALTSITPPPC